MHDNTTKSDTPGANITKADEGSAWVRKPPRCTATRHRWRYDPPSFAVGGTRLEHYYECVHCGARRRDYEPGPAEEGDWWDTPDTSYSRAAKEGP